MANIPLKTLKFPGLDDTYTVPVVDDTLTTAGDAADAKKVGDEISDIKNDLEAIPSGVYPNMVSGGLIGDSYTVDKVPYLLRPSHSGKAQTGSIVGGSVAWNQLVDSTDTSVTVVSGHKYISYIGSTWGIGTSDGTAITVDGSGGDMLSDITQMFGSTIADYIYTLESGTEGAGIAKLSSWGFFTDDYYAYNTGSLESVSGVSAKETVVKNLFLSVSKKIALGFRGVDGSITYTAENFTPILPILIKAGKKVTISTNNPIYNIGYVVEDLNGAVIARANNNNTSSVTLLAYSQDIYLYLWFNNQIEFTIESAIEFIRSYEIQVEIGDERTDYVGEPYTYPLDSSLTLRGIPKLDSNNQLYYDGDIYAADGTVTRKYGVVDLGTLTWTHESGANSQFNYFQSRPTPNALNSTTNLISTKYAVGNVGYASGDDCKMMVTASGNYLRIRDLSYTDAATFKAAMSGVYLVYELDTPTTETADAYEEYQIVEADGTEQFVSTGIVPVGHDTKYYTDLGAKAETIPDAPTTDGTYTLTCTVSSGVPTYTWA